MLRTSIKNKEQSETTSQQPQQPQHRSGRTPVITFSVAALAGVATALLWRYKIAGPSEYVVRTGFGIKDISISKKAILWPFQHFGILDITPTTFSFVLHAMSREKMEFQLPVQFTIGPYNDLDNLKNYSVRLSTIGRDKLEELVKGIIEGGTRGMAANLSIEEIFSDRIKFKSDIKASVQHDLDQFGLFIFNANIKELVDAEGSEYFVYLRQKTKENAINQAKIEVAEARLKGDVGEKDRVGQTRREMSKIEAETVVFENSRQQEIKHSEAELEKRMAHYNREIKIAKIESEKAAAIRESELQKEVEVKRLEQETERLRAEKLSKARVEAEALIQKADGEAAAKQRQASADLFQKQREAEAVLAHLTAQADGLARLTAAANSDFKNVINYFMIEKNMYPQLAEANAKAIQGLNPKITVWNTGSSKETDSLQTFRDIYTSLPPLVKTIHEQTGIQPPEWMLKLPKNEIMNDAEEPKVKNTSK